MRYWLEGLLEGLWRHEYNGKSKRSKAFIVFDKEGGRIQKSMIVPKDWLEPQCEGSSYIVFIITIIMIIYYGFNTSIYKYSLKPVCKLICCGAMFHSKSVVLVLTIYLKQTSEDSECSNLQQLDEVLTQLERIYLLVERTEAVPQVLHTAPSRVRFQPQSQSWPSFTATSLFFFLNKILEKLLTDVYWNAWKVVESHEKPRTALMMTHKGLTAQVIVVHPVNHS